MAIAKPVILETDIWANTPVDPTADLIKPPNPKAEEGWRYGEKPYSAFANYNQNRNDSFIMNVNQNGVPEWDSVTVYNKGALALFTDDLFHSLQAANKNHPETDTAWWKPGAGGTGAGMLWSAATNYIEGDMVSYDGPPYTYYTALTTNTAKNPTAGLPHWEEYGTDYHNSVAVTYTPVAGTEYPPTTADTLGAVWYVTGLGVTGVTPNIYTYTGGDLSGQTVRDDDKLIWVAGTTGSEKWHLTPFPRINNEQGGINWIAQVAYKIGDIISESGDTYICTGNHTSAGFVGDAANWKKVTGTGTGIPASTTYDNSYTYLEGDIVTIGDQLYIAGVGGAGPGVTPPGAGWLNEGKTSYVNVTGDTMTGPLNMGANDITITAVPVATTDVTNKAYVDNIIAPGGPADLRYVEIAGDTMTGQLNVPNATGGNNAMNRNTSDGRYVEIAGDTMTGPLNMGANKITGLAKATANDDAVSADAYAGTTLGGTLKARLKEVPAGSGDWTLYLTNDGSNP